MFMPDTGTGTHDFKWNLIYAYNGTLYISHGERMLLTPTGAIPGTSFKLSANFRNYL